MENANLRLMGRMIMCRKCIDIRKKCIAIRESILIFVKCVLISNFFFPLHAYYPRLNEQRWARRKQNKQCAFYGLFYLDKWIESWVGSVDGINVLFWMDHWPNQSSRITGMGLRFLSLKLALKLIGLWIILHIASFYI